MSYLREVQVFIGPLTESQGGGDTSQAIVVKSAGRDDEQRIVFKVNKSLVGNNFSTISIFNLKSSTRQILQKQATNIILQAGYKDGPQSIRTIAIGSLSPTISSRQEGDIKTTFSAYDGLDGLSLGVFNNSYKGQVRLINIVKDLAASLPGVKVQDASVQIDDTTFGQKGIVLSGRSTNLLDKLAREWGFSWSIREGVFQAVSDQSAGGTSYPFSTESGNLLHVSPRLENVLQPITGIEITTLLDPRIQPNDQIVLNSSVMPELNNTYRVTNVIHSGDTHGQQWTSTIQCLFNLGLLQNAQRASV